MTYQNAAYKLAFFLNHYNFYKNHKDRKKIPLEPSELPCAIEPISHYAKTILIFCNALKEQLETPKDQKTLSQIMYTMKKMSAIGDIEVPGGHPFYHFGNRLKETRKQLRAQRKAYASAEEEECAEAELSPKETEVQREAEAPILIPMIFKFTHTMFVEINFNGHVDDNNRPLYTLKLFHPKPIEIDVKNFLEATFRLPPPGEFEYEVLTVDNIPKDSKQYHISRHLIDRLMMATLTHDKYNQVLDHLYQNILGIKYSDKLALNDEGVVAELPVVKTPNVTVSQENFKFNKSITLLQYHQFPNALDSLLVYTFYQFQQQPNKMGHICDIFNEMEKYPYISNYNIDEQCAGLNQEASTTPIPEEGPAPPEIEESSEETQESERSQKRLSLE